MHNRVQIGCSQSISECLSCLGSVIFAVIHPQKDQKSFLEERNRQLEDRLKLRRNDFKYLFAFEISSHQNTPLVHRVFASKLTINKAKQLYQFQHYCQFTILANSGFFLPKNGWSLRGSPRKCFKILFV